VKKVARRLKFWSRKPDQINARALCCFLNILHLEGISPVPMECPEAKICCGAMYLGEHRSAPIRKRVYDKYWTNEDCGSVKPGKIFDVDAKGQVTIWPKASHAVEAFRKARGIGLSLYPIFPSKDDTDVNKFTSVICSVG
jgi:hypothetical protein